MKSLIKKRREQRALCPKCLSPDYQALNKNGKHPDCYYFKNATSDWLRDPSKFLNEWQCVSFNYQINLKPQPLWQCRSCGHLFQTETNGIHHKLS